MEELEKLSEEQQAVLVHEAGHAALAISRGITTVEVRLGFDGKGEAITLSAFRGFSPSDNRQRIAVLMAGYFAERRFTSQKDHGDFDRGDIKMIVIEDGIDELEQAKIEHDVNLFLNSDFNARVLPIAELLAYNYNNGKRTTYSAELLQAYSGRRL